MKDILVILTGGTIGSCIKNGSIDIDNSSKCMVVEKYKELYEKELKCTKPNHTAQNNDSDTDVTDRFEVRESFSILSENSTVSYLNALLTEDIPVIFIVAFVPVLFPESKASTII